MILDAVFSIGLFGLAAYGVIDRLLLPRIRGTDRPAESH